MKAVRVKSVANPNSSYYNNSHDIQIKIFGEDVIMPY